MTDCAPTFLKNKPLQGYYNDHTRGRLHTPVGGWDMNKYRRNMGKNNFGRLHFQSFHLVFSFWSCFRAAQQWTASHKKCRITPDRATPHGLEWACRYPDSSLQIPRIIQLQSRSSKLYYPPPQSNLLNITPLRRRSFFAHPSGLGSHNPSFWGCISSPGPPGF